MTTEQKIVRILQMGYRLTISNDCGRMICGMHSQSSEYDRAYAESPEFDGPNSAQLDALVDQLYQEASNRWSKRTGL